MIDAQTDFRTTLGGKASSCLTLPACARNGAYNSNETICPKPLIASKSKLALEHGLSCSPACDQGSWKSGVFGTSSYIITCVSVPLIWICNAVLFITWANAKKLLSYQSVTGSFLLVSLSALSTAATIPLILGPKRTFCKHESMVDSQNDPTTVCYIQGLIGQFSYASCLIWWLTSVFNAVMTVCKPEKFGHRSYKKSLILQLTLLLLYVGGQATFVFIHDVKYARKAPYGIVCTPTSNVWLFYLTLPAVVAILCGTLMSVFVMVKLHQAREISLRGISAEKRYKIIEEYALVQKRFFLLCIIIPLSFASTMVATIIHSKTLPKKYVNYSDCLVTTNRTEVDRCISQLLPDIGWIGTSISWILIDLCVIALVAYCLIPKSARIVWLKLWKKCKKRQFRERWRADMPEYSSEVTQLFSSTTERALNSLSED
ncbi:frizzled and smoothened-like protein C [Oscarella lobularis]|uniref:frizzled and smoothened-like protein C n=1 Tax=Oscarella lobularis TaxID=121494 RepID=UPI0033136BDF